MPSPPTLSAIVFAQETAFDLDEIIALYRDSTLGARRPIDDRAIVADMYAHANLIITARHNGALVGVSRSLTDFSYVAYLSDLAVHVDYQRIGIGEELMRQTQARMGPRSSIVLLAAPAATEYYPKVGFTKADSAWVAKAADTIGKPGQPGHAP
jgi:predicted N-acetyltransferase YhbS